MSSTSTTWTVDTNTKSGGAQTFSTSISSLKILGEEGSDAILKLFADEGDDNADHWRLVSSSSSNKLNFMTLSSGSWSTVLDLYGAGGAVVINEDSADIDFRVESDSNTHMLFVDSGNNKVGIGTATPDNLIEIAHTEGAAVTGANIANNTIKGIHISGPYADTDAAGSVLKFSTGATTGDVCQSAIAHIQDDNNNADLAFYTDTSGTLNEAMRIDNSQNIGIGTTAPDYSLNISKAGAVCVLAIDAYSDTASHAPSIYFRKADGTEADPDLVAAADILGQMVFYGWDKDSGGEYLEAAKIFVKAGSPTTGENDMPGSIYFSTTADGAASATDRMVIGYDGNVGIGTAAPSALLHVESAAESPTLMILDTTDASHSSSTNVGIKSTISLRSDSATLGEARINHHYNKTVNNNSNLSFQTWNHAAAALIEGLRIDENGNVGIGATEPDNILEVSHNVTTAVAVAQIFDNTIQGIHIAKTGTNDGAGSMLKFSADGDTNQAAIVHIADDTSGDANLAFYTSDAVDAIIERMRITSDGNVGIGTASPADIDGSGLEIKGSTHATLVLRTAGSIDTSNSQIKFYDTTSLKWSIHNAGSTHKMRILDHDLAQGVDLTQDDGDGWAVVSDERWKSDWTEYSDVLDNIKTLRAGKYKFKNLLNGNIPDVWNSGLIAQDVEKFLPDCVHTSMEESDSGESFERKTLSYQAIIPYLVKAVQELSAEVEKLKNK